MILKGSYNDVNNIEHTFNIESLKNLKVRFLVIEPNNNLISAYIAPVVKNYDTIPFKHVVERDKKVFLFKEANKVIFTEITNFIVTVYCSSIFIRKLKYSILDVRSQSNVAIDALMVSTIYCSSSSNFLYNRGFGNYDIIQR